ncbi:MAG: glutamine synthetase family protein [Candidatus Thorarchaeota archaeon]
MSEKINYVAFQFSDLLGRMKTMIVPCNPAETLDKLKADPIMKNGTSVDGSSITGLAQVEASDLRLRPDPDTLVELPFFSQRVAAAMCFVQKKIEADSAAYHSHDGRGVLRMVHQKLMPDSYSLKIKTEPEFYFITSDGDTFDDGQYADIYPAASGQDTLLEIGSAIQKMGIQLRVLHHEVGEAQYEIELSFTDSRDMADNILRFRNVAHEIAQENGHEATFMPKPFEGLAGNGLHCHIQLWDGDKNLFGGEEPGQLSETALHFLAGLLEHAPAITAIANPTINSYKRLVPNQEAPVYICWGYRNRTALIRIPLFSDPQKAAIEFRSPDPMANPYLLFASFIAAGMDGIKRKLTPPEDLKGDAFEMDSDKLEELGITTLPENLYDALVELASDEVIKEALGSDLVDAYLDLKLDEWEEYTNHAVTDWEWHKYSEA